MQACVRAGALALVLCVASGQWGPLLGQPATDASSGAPATTAAQDEFVPISELPPEDRLPAAPFLVAAYTITLVLLAGYVWLLWRRVGALQHELNEVRRTTRPGGAPM
jgi:CcmD family protein